MTRERSHDPFAGHSKRGRASRREELDEGVPLRALFVELEASDDVLALLDERWGETTADERAEMLAQLAEFDDDQQRELAQQLLDVLSSDEGEQTSDGGEPMGDGVEVPADGTAAEVESEPAPEPKPEPKRKAKSKQVDWSGMTVKDLRAAAKKAKLPVSGTKGELVKRLEAHHS